MSIFNFDLEELFTFFCVLVRFSILFSILPFIGDRVVPVPLKILMALVISIAIFPALISSNDVNPADAARWATSVSGICLTITLEVIFALLLGFTAKVVFESISFGANLVGTFMGFATASSFDPHQESQTQMVAQIQTSLAMLIFLTLDGHHLMLRSALDSYRIVGIGKAAFSGVIADRLIQITGQVLRFGLQLAAPAALSLFSVNVVFGIISKAIPQMNILMISFSITSLIGLVVMWLSISEFQGVLAIIFEKVYDWMQAIMLAIAHK